ncbi:MAG: ABC transporter permease, partial [Rhizobiaceae bacterium]
MTDATMSNANAPLLAADGTPLKEKLARTTRRMKMRAFLLTVPLVLFLLLSFVLPIGQMLYRSFHNPTGSNVMPNFAQAIKDWDAEQGIPDDEIVKIFVTDMATARKNREVGKTIGNLATRVNYEIPGSRSLFTKTA